jgi:hypothetical protein
VGQLIPGQGEVYIITVQVGRKSTPKEDSKIKRGDIQKYTALTNAFFILKH